MYADNYRNFSMVVLLLLWLFLSAFYYSGNFFTGNLISGADANPIHVLGKYFFALSVGLFFVFSYKMWNVLFLYLYFILLGFPFVFWLLKGHDVLHAAVIFLVFFSFSAFIFIVDRLTEKNLNLILDVIIYSALLVSLITYYEYFFMWSILGTYWEATGGYRSVSTLLNPNNLGIYLGASIIILILRKRFCFLIRFSFLITIMTAFLMSGSRTAIVSLVLPLLIGVVFVSLSKVRINSLIVIFILSVTSIVFLFVFIERIDGLFLRFQNLDTASIRLEKYLAYLTMLDSSYLLPDFNGDRFYYVSESSYFHLMNSLGLIFTILIFLPAFIFKINFNYFNFSPARKVLAFLVAYYLIAFFFENMLVSFPNNQLFFFALGALLKPRRLEKVHFFKHYFYGRRTNNA